jgi:hypothetical protein
MEKWRKAGCGLVCNPLFSASPENKMTIGALDIKTDNLNAPLSDQGLMKRQEK